MCAPNDRITAKAVFKSSAMTPVARFPRILVSIDVLNA
jgi:hypothetical protein